MIKLSEIKNHDTIWKIHKDYISQYVNIRGIRGNEFCIAFDYGDDNNYDIDYGYPNSFFKKEDEINLFYTQKEAFKEIENRKNELEKKLQDETELIRFLYKKAKSELSEIEKDICKNKIKKLS